MKNSDREAKQRKKRNEVFDYICEELLRMRCILKSMYLTPDVNVTQGLEPCRKLANSCLVNREDESIEHLIRRINNLRDLMWDILIDEKPLSQILKERGLKEKANPSP